MAAATGNFAQFHDSLAHQDVTQGSTVDIDRDTEAMRKLKILNNGIEQNQKQQKILFRVIIGIVTVSVFVCLAVNVCAAWKGTHLEATALVSFNAAIAVQSFLLMSVLAKSLFPSGSAQKDKVDEDSR